MPPLLDKTTDQRIVHQGTWEQFKLIQKGFEGSPGIRLFYYDGAICFSSSACAIEILMPGHRKLLASGSKDKTVRIWQRELSENKAVC
jgi:hypothetical protein